MPELSEWETSDLADIRGREARYQALSDQLVASVKAGTTLPEADFEELNQLQSALAGDAKRLLAMIDHLRGSR